MNNGLSDYAISHMVMVDIGKRFERVVARHPKHKTPKMAWRIDMARDSARRQSANFPMETKIFDLYVHRKPFP